MTDEEKALRNLSDQLASIVLAAISGDYPGLKRATKRYNRQRQRCLCLGLYPDEIDETMRAKFFDHVFQERRS